MSVPIALRMSNAERRCSSAPTSHSILLTPFNITTHTHCSALSGKRTAVSKVHMADLASAMLPDSPYSQAVLDNGFLGPEAGDHMKMLETREEPPRARHTGHLASSSLRCCDETGVTALGKVGGRPLRTGVPDLDSLLGAGLSYPAMLEITGASASGKTELMLTVCFPSIVCYTELKYVSGCSSPGGTGPCITNVRDAQSLASSVPMARASARRAAQDALTAQYALQMCGECTLPGMFEGVHVGGNEASVLYLCLGSAATDNITRLVTIYDSHARRALASAGRKQDSEGEGEDEDWVAAFVRDCLARVHFLECATSLELMAAALSIGTCCPRLHRARCRK